MRLTGQGIKGLGFPLVSSAIFIAATVFATMMLAASITSSTSGDRVSYYAEFTDVAGLHTSHGVRVAGVEVGQVQKISVTKRRLALVKFSVDRDRQLPGSATAAVKYLNLVGGRYIALEQGTGSPGQVLRPGGTIPAERTTGPLNLTALFQGFQPLMQALSPGDVNALSESVVKVLQGEGGTVESLLRTVAQLTNTIADKDQVIGQVITNLNAVVGDVNARDQQLVNLITTLRKLTSGLASDRKPIGEAVAGVADLTNAVADLFHDIRPPLRDDVVQLGRLTRNLERDEPLVDRFLKRLPGKLTTFGRLGSYGSWLNFYQCEVKLTGVHLADTGLPDQPPPTGIPISDENARRCRG